MQSVRAAGDDRLPWLEPYRETKTPGRPLPSRGYSRPLIAGTALGLLIAAAGAGYWFGQRSEAPPPASSTTVALAPPPRAEPKIAEAPQAPVVVSEPANPAVSDPVPVPQRASMPAPAKKVAKRKSTPRKKIRTARVENRRLDAVRARQERQALSRRWPKMPSPGPAGQVIQLGAFSTATRANSAYQMRIARYPTLARMPKVVVPVVTKPDGRILYVLRLGTTSRQHSKTVCRNLRASGDHCLVIG